jgi:hypothetical protein
VAKFISENLNPFPDDPTGVTSVSRNPQTQIYCRPDILISRVNDTNSCQLMVEILFPIWGTLRVTLYRQAISRRKQIKRRNEEDLERASLFVNAFSNETTPCSV